MTALTLLGCALILFGSYLTAGSLLLAWIHSWAQKREPVADLYDVWEEADDDRAGGH
ncbi:hypothetical protein [Nonomuraea sp. PA05]|uniref:hypothetical protein n=1 Tax=Nonomuraea sp. PA05 TaxID=2604466 RepID=UPI0016523F69|nr:hypothetical protein [Nonomuraea sp. PA05]